MTIRFRAASVASMALVFGLGGGGGLRQVFRTAPEGGQGVQGRQHACTRRRTGRGPPSGTRRSSAGHSNPELGHGLFLPRQQLRPALQAGQGRATPQNDAYIQKAIDNYRRPPQQEPDPKMEEAGAGVSRRRLRVRQAERPGQGRAGLPANHPLEPNEPANYMPLAKLYEDAGRYDDAEAQYVKAKETRSRTTRPSTRTWPATTTGRETSRRRSRRSRRPPISSRTTPRATTASPPSTGTRLARTSACRPPRRRTTS